MIPPVFLMNEVLRTDYFVADVATLLRDIGVQIDNELVRVLQASSGSKDYQTLAERTEQWTQRIKTKLNAAHEQRNAFMGSSRIQFCNAREDTSLLILEKFEWVGTTEEWKMERTWEP